MPSIPVTQVKQGDKIIEDVHTALGSVLFAKGKIVHNREIEILKAFLVPLITIEKRQDTETETAKTDEQKAPEVQVKSVLPFFAEYEKMFILLRDIFRKVGLGGNIPILETRNQLENLLSRIDNYNILTFTPKNSSVNDYVVHNSIMACLTSYCIARWNGFARKDLLPIAMAGLLHDIGNAKVDPGLLNKPSKLTQSELDDVKKHTIFGYNILKLVPAINEGVKLTALQHHEKFDGSGYPLGLNGEKIHVYARIVAIADIFHAMTSPRNHKKALSPYLVLEQIMTDSFGKLDPKIVQTFILKVTQFHNGTVIRLSDARVGNIVFTDQATPTRPMVNVSGKIINLATERNLFIQEVIQM